VSSRWVAIALAAGRTAFGTAMAVAPRRLLGAKAAGADGQVLWLVRAFGIRDAAVGVGALRALVSGGDGAPWVGLGAATDAADAAAAVIWRRELGRAPAAAMAAVAAGAAVAGWGAGRRLTC